MDWKNIKDELPEFNMIDSDGDKTTETLIFIFKDKGASSGILYIEKYDYNNNINLACSNVYYNFNDIVFWATMPKIEV